MSPTTLATHFDAMRTERRDGQVTVRVRETADQIEAEAENSLSLFVHVTDVETPYGPVTAKTVLKQYETVGEFFGPVIDLIVVTPDGTPFLATFDDVDDFAYTPWKILVTLR